jgi:hypothetical protein
MKKSLTHGNILFVKLKNTGNLTGGEEEVYSGGHKLSIDSPVTRA